MGRRPVGAATPQAQELAIVVRGLTKAYGSVPVLRGLDLEVAPGTVTAVLGVSGSGKTTLLRVIAGFEHADSGSLALAGRVVDDGRRVLRARHRAVGYVPQEAGLFPHLTVRANIAFGLSRSERRRAADLEAMVGLGGLGHRYPHQLSGGQQQRVALARALAVDPAVVLLDEPFGSLDVALRAGLRAEVMAILREAKATTVLVTHDQDEALATADRIAVLDGGRLLAHGSPRELYDHPPTPQVAAALGTANILPGRLDAGFAHCRLGAFRVPTASGHAGTECLLMIRPENLVLDARSATPSATVAAVSYHGHDTLVGLRGDHPDDPPLLARLPGGVVPDPGTRVGLSSTVTPHVWIPAAPALD
ncbi:MAG TPA: ABC transporter ATP-binding protein [Sporichthyaceae bacterium]|nr:ABC transporter ATP-binding protein [Sporichthyaceae bacterium]